jgi:hypothetical protein
LGPAAERQLLNTAIAIADITDTTIESRLIVRSIEARLFAEPSAPIFMPEDPPSLMILIAHCAVAYQV